MRIATKGYLPPGPVFVWVSSQKRLRVQIVDSGPGRIGIVADSAWNFELGFHVQVEDKRGRHAAAVESLDRMRDGRLRIGLTWDKRQRSLA